MTSPRNLIAFALVLTATLATGQQPSLKEAYKNDFLIGVAVNKSEIFETDARDTEIVKAQFNSISPENVLKWEIVHPEPNTYDFSASDRYVEFGEKNNMFIIGHNLVWHNQVPKWVFEDDKGAPLNRKKLLKRLRDHISTVVGRYKGRIKGWDVVNEALDEDGSLRQSPWLKIIGPDYIEEAFKAAHKADPNAELYYNDYSLENEPKRNGAIALIKKLKAKGITVTGVGMQGHISLIWPTLEQEDASIAAFAVLGLKVMITEFDIDVLPRRDQNQTAEVSQSAEYQAKLNPYVDGLPGAVQQALADRYAGLFGVFLKHRDVITRVTFWGVADNSSWLNNWPIRGRTSYPLLFDRQGHPKPAFDAVIRAAQAAH
jgi:endo-1,4-beta-xylanase